MVDPIDRPLLFEVLMNDEERPARACPASNPKVKQKLTSEKRFRDLRYNLLQQAPLLAFKFLPEQSDNSLSG